MRGHGRKGIGGIFQLIEDGDAEILGKLAQLGPGLLNLGLAARP